MSLRRAVFLDRDGVLNRAVVRHGKPHPPLRVGEVVLLAGTSEACSLLRAAGFLLVMVTNQPDIARGKTTLATVEAVNQKVARSLGIDVIQLCPHDDADACLCRKPQPGMLRRAAAEWDLDLKASFMVGDRWKDIEAGHRAGCRAVWIESDYAEPSGRHADCTVASLWEAAQWMVKQK